MFGVFKNCFILTKFNQLKAHGTGVMFYSGNIKNIITRFLNLKLFAEYRITVLNCKSLTC